MEQIGGVLEPQIMQGEVDGFQQNRFGEQIGAVPVLQIWEPVGEVSCPALHLELVGRIARRS